MRIKLHVLPLVASFVLVSSIAFAQARNDDYQSLKLVNFNSNVNAPLTSQELKFITEVYGDKTEEYVLKIPQRLKAIKNILRNRVEYKNTNNGESFKKCPLLSEVPLFDTYVKSLSRDIVFDKTIFNPLKYEFNFYSRGNYLFKVDNSDYYIIINSQNQ